jgi:Tfp pilus assembly protein PilF
VELAPDSVTSLQALAALHYMSGEYEAAEKVQRQAIALNPHDPESLAQLGWRLNARGRPDDAVRLLQEAVDRSVSPPPWYYANLAFAQYLAGDHGRARETARLGKDHCCGIGMSALAITEAAVGNEAAARAALDEAVREAPILASDPHALWANFGVADPVIDCLNAGLVKAGLHLPPPSADTKPRS